MEAWNQVSVRRQQKSEHVVRRLLKTHVTHTHRWGKLAWRPVPSATHASQTARNSKLHQFFALHLFVC